MSARICLKQILALPLFNSAIAISSNSIGDNCMRAMRKIKKQLEEKEAYELLKECQIVTISMYDEEEKEPYAVMVNPIVIDHTIYIHCANEGRKIDVLKKKSSVCITALVKSSIVERKYTTAYESIVMYSHSQFIENDEEKERILYELCKQYTPNNKIESTKKLIDAELNNTTIIKFDIESISAKGSNREKLS
ncbi:MAG: pyridoxamine 5'-phosphate oxidase family protein [Sphaerochaetaceae bacterium]